MSSVVLITGASSGIGEALALEYAKYGARLALCARRTDRLQDLVRRIESIGGQAIALTCDVRKREDLDLAVSATVNRFGHLDVVIVNAGFGVYGRLDQLDLDDYRRQFETNVFGALSTVQASLPALERARGRIALVGSGFSYFAFPQLSPYCMSKYAIKALADSLYFEMRSRGVSVTLICPGAIGTEFRKVDTRGELRLERSESMPSWMVASPQSAARAIRRGVEARKREVVITAHARFGIWVQRYFPGLYAWTITRTSPWLERFAAEKLL